MATDGKTKHTFALATQTIPPISTDMVIAWTLLPMKEASIGSCLVSGWSWLFGKPEDPKEDDKAFVRYLRNASLTCLPRESFDKFSQVQEGWEVLQEDLGGGWSRPWYHHSSVEARSSWRRLYPCEKTIPEKRQAAPQPFIGKVPSQCPSVLLDPYSPRLDDAEDS